MSSRSGSVAHTGTYVGADGCSNPNYHNGILFQNRFPFARKIYLKDFRKEGVWRTNLFCWNLTHHQKTAKRMEKNASSYMCMYTLVCACMCMYWNKIKKHVGLGAERRSGGDQRLHSPTAWRPPGHEPGAGGVAQLPSSKKGPPRA
jgi:hypothetical protein